MKTIKGSYCFGTVVFLLQCLLVSCTLHSQNLTENEAYKQNLANRWTAIQSMGGDASGLSQVNSVTRNKQQNLTDQQYAALMQQTRLAYLDVLKKKISIPTNKLYTELVSPWKDISTDLFPVNNTAAVSKGIQIKNILKGRQYAAFWVCNLDNAPQTVTLKCAKTGGLSQVSFYDAQFQLSRNLKYIPDALVPVSSSVMAPGEVKVFYVAVDGVKPGTESNQVIISGKYGSSIIPLSIQNFGITVTRSAINLNAITWPYFFYPIMNGKEKAASENLQTHYINSLVVTVNKLPLFQDLSNTAAFDEYALLCKDYQHLILDFDLRRQAKAADYLSPSWKAQFLKWYAFTINRYQSFGIPKEKIMLMLSDEPTPDEMDYMSKFTAWIRTAAPDAKLFSTSNNATCTAILLPILDVVQIYSNTVLGVQATASNMRKIWIYDTKNKTMPPYTSFRLMAWEAFYKGYGGIGFWNFADIPTGGSAWNDFKGKYEPYNAVYDYKNTFINSRRWEAFRLGMEDYYILSMYAQKHGLNAAKELSRKVLSNPDDINMADATRNTLLNGL
ncbi:hypothetical protein ACE38W_20580 [Chitinophaga sp. Hz27]|uniref:hypothetical protein n=1 Tax=Chitinophaga sp. Hz27 TaxID=3347169 RepID=UPI0035DB1E7F